MKKFLGKEVLVIGLGVTGRSVISYLGDKGSHVTGYDIDLDDKKVNFFKGLDLDVRLVSGDLLSIIDSYIFDYVVLSPGISAYSLPIIKAKEKGFKVTTDIEIFLEELDRGRTKIIAITGSNGKSTVTKLCYFLCTEYGLKARYAGNIGIPVLDILSDIEGGLALDVVILELSSFQLESISNLSADAATCLNISEDHLDRYTNLLEYAYVKDRVFNGVRVQVLNYDDIFCMAMARDRVSRVWVSFEDSDCEYYLEKTRDGIINLMHLGKKLTSMDGMSIYGLHNGFNILTSLALCSSIGVEINSLVGKLSKFRGLSHRIEKVASIKGIIFIDDSKGTNVGATCAAINSINSPIILIAGGMGKGQDFSLLGQLIIKKVSMVFLIGKDADDIFCSLSRVGYVNCRICSSLEEATLLSFNFAKSGDVILLSPACASYDMFRDYEHRSEVFCEVINKIKLLNVK